jgi:hypothetical protein
MDGGCRLAWSDPDDPTQHGVQDRYVLLRLGRAAKQQYVIRLLTESEKAGRLVWEMKRD